MLKWGNTEITVLKWGNTTCTAAYWGNTKVFPTNNGYDGSSFVTPLSGIGYYSLTNNNPSNRSTITNGVSMTSYSYTYGDSIFNQDVLFRSTNKISQNLWNTYKQIKVKCTIKINGTSGGTYRPYGGLFGLFRSDSYYENSSETPWSAYTPSYQNWSNFFIANSNRTYSNCKINRLSLTNDTGVFEFYNITQLSNLLSPINGYFGIVINPFCTEGGKQISVASHSYTITLNSIEFLTSIKYT